MPAAQRLNRMTRCIDLSRGETRLLADPANDLLGSLGWEMSLKTILGRVLISLVLFANGTGSVAQPVIDGRWGLLAEMAEKDYRNTDKLMTVRWESPNEILVVSRWNRFDQALRDRFTLDRSTGLVTLQFGKEQSALVAGPDGVLIDKVKGQVFLTREPPEAIRFRWPDGVQEKFTALAPGDSKVLRLSRITAAGKERAANPMLADGARGGSITGVPTASVAQAAPASAVKAEPVQSPVAFASTGPRLALLIGNSNYGAALGSLPNPVNDAATMTQALRSVGFDVETVTNADQKTIKRAIARFGERLRAAGPGSTGLFFYAGHGIQSRGTNYLIPVGATIQAEADVDLESVAADTVLLQMEEAGSSTNIVILDACRNMPLSRSFRSGTRGLARMEAPNGSFVAYSTAPGSVAADGDGKNSPFVTALAQQIRKKGQPIEVVFRDVRRMVLESTGGKQTPWDSSSLISPFYFVGE